MNIKQIKIRNFKSIENLNIEFNNKFNVLIGENNAGKTTILEAMLLWKKCYDSHIQQNKKKFYAKPQNIRFDNISFLRVSDDIDLFNKIYKKSGCIDIELIFEDDEDEYSLGFEISKVNNIDNAYFQLKYINRSEFIRFEMLTDKYGKKLNELIVFFDTRPIASIITKEPYMYKDQVISKISKGKGYEVLRNKIIGHASNKESKKRIENSIINVIGEEFEFVEKNQGNKEYIKLMVKKGNDTVDILSQGSGFIQMAEIFSSIEYINSELYILLIDEPDSHIHAKLQKKLLKEFKQIKSSQMFLVTHNERFLDNVDDNEIIFINKKDKDNGYIKPLSEGEKSLVLHNIVGDLEEIEKIRYADKVVFLEGPSDKRFIELIYNKYSELTKLNSSKIVHFNILNGIDQLNVKLKTLTNIFKTIGKSSLEWIVVRDTDFTPLNKVNDISRKIEDNIIAPGYKKIIFQNGYGIESTFFSDKEKLTNIISKHYGTLPIQSIKIIVNELNDEFINEYKVSTTDIHFKLYENFNNQNSRRRYDFEFIDYMRNVEDKLQYIMTKSLIDIYLKRLNDKVITKFGREESDLLSRSGIIDIYINNINCIEDFYEHHISLLNDIFEIVYNDELNEIAVE